MFWCVLCVCAQGHVYVEMGAGRGTLSLTLREAVPACHIVLIERGSQRNKADPQMKDWDSRDSLVPQPDTCSSFASAASFVRVRIDIA